MKRLQTFNEITQLEFDTSVGKNGARCTSELLTFLYGGTPKLSVIGRHAPSMEMRSECQLLGLSHPRFVHRLLITENKGFVDIRRLSLMADSVGSFSSRPTYALADTLDDVKEDTAPIDAAALIRQSKPVAGALLAPPKRFADGTYRILQADLGEVLGEPGYGPGTPFLQHLPFGGGMCAQACMSMACLLQHQWANNICGVSELTVLARRNLGLNGFEIRVSGLNATNVTSVLNSQFIGLAATHEALPQIPGAEDCFRLALRSYLLSAVPLIFPCDLNELHKQLYPINNLAVPSTEEPHLHHAVLLVGCSLLSNNDTVIVNDPSRYPFLNAPLNLLRQCTPFVPAGRELESLISVRAGMVKVPLLDEYECQPDETTQSQSFGVDKFVFKKRGLLSMCLLLRGLSSKRVPTDWLDSSHLPANIGDFRLFHIDSIIDGAADFESFLRDEPENDSACLPIRRAAISGTSFPQWVWIQTRRHHPDHNVKTSIWVWDATDADNLARLDYTGNASSPHPNLILCMATHHDTPLVTYFSKWDDPLSTSSSLGVGTQLAILSSFSANGLIHAHVNMPSEVKCSELYMLMGGDVANSEGQLDRFSAVEYLARATEDGQVLQQLVTHVLRVWEEHGKMPVAMATYIPQITQDPSKDVAKTAVKALTAVGLIAEQVRSRIGHKRFVCEFVAGSRVDAVWRRKSSSGRDAFCATVLEDDVALDRVFGALNSVIRSTSQDVIYAVELEPGLLNLVNNLPSLVNFCNRIEKYGMAHRIGVNLDMSHFSLAGVSPEAVKKTATVYDKIVHSHASGHWNKAHASDLAIPNTDRNDMCAWLHLIRSLPKSTQPGRSRKIPFSGIVTVELEACRDLTDVELSVRNLRKLLAMAE